MKSKSTLLAVMTPGLALPTTSVALEADGFPKEGFAKHMGQKVTVRGTSNSGSARPLFKVRSIETVSETCAPTQGSEKK